MSYLLQFTSRYYRSITNIMKRSSVITRKHTFIHCITAEDIIIMLERWKFVPTPNKQKKLNSWLNNVSVNGTLPYTRVIDRPYIAPNIIRATVRGSIRFGLPRDKFHSPSCYAWAMIYSNLSDSSVININGDIKN